MPGLSSESTRRPMDPILALIEKRERGDANTREELSAFVTAAVSQQAPEELIVRWLRAVKNRGMEHQELSDYTMALAHSGRVLSFGSHPAAGKHAPGGVGENTSGPIDAIVAACGVYAPIYTGARLQHTPGTVDRFGSIPGFQIFLDPNTFHRQVEQIGIAMTGQTKECAPGDGVLYALREKHGLVMVDDHILASVLSKKFASGATSFGLLMTFGNGAFIADEAAARRMAERMQGVAACANARCSATLVAMHAPLGDVLSTTSLAVAEGIRLLRNEPVSPALREAVLRVAATMLLDGKAESTLEAARARAESTLTSGRALQKFQELLQAQGANPQIGDNPLLLPQPTESLEIRAPTAGFVVPYTRELGNAANALAGAYNTPEFDPTAGIILTPEGRYGSQVSQGAVIARVLGCRRVRDLQEHVAAGFTITTEPPPAIERFPV